MSAETDTAVSTASATSPRRTVESRDPATGTVWRRFDAAGDALVNSTLARAREALPAWRAQPVRERVALIGEFHRELFRRRHDVARTIARENGKAVPEALAAEVAVVLDMARFVSRNAPVVLSSSWFTPSSLTMWRKRVRVEQEPLGVIAIVSPWNYPFMLPAGSMLAALATGNVAVLKPSEYTPSSAVLLEELVAAAGFPPDVFAVVQGDGATGAALVSGDVDKVFFTGSDATGRHVARACAERLVPCVLELGGSDAAIVLRDADVAHAASGIVWGRFANGGQTCVAPKRVFVEAPAHDRFVAAVRERLGRLRVGAGPDDAFDVGALIRPSQHDALAAQLDDALARGALVAAQSPSDAAAQVTFVPTLLVDVPPDARVLREETFGPLLPVVAVRDADEAVARANDSPYGLSASVWGTDRARALAVARRLYSGTVMINDVVAVAGMADVPHGGVKASGTGRSHGIAGLEECVQPRAIVVDRFATWRQAWWFGYDRRSTADIDGYLRLQHGHSLRERIRGISATLRLLFRPERPV
ncbi:MAG: Phenylacetaldehyde dehydrogenase [Gemmatimonadaceae bacterium]|nr:Phenylacetaldehyde dehydrogenase [Gemmatimonadaceae bacterium]